MGCLRVSASYYYSNINSINTTNNTVVPIFIFVFAGICFFLCYYFSFLLISFLFFVVFAIIFYFLFFIFHARCWSFFGSRCFSDIFLSTSRLCNNNVVSSDWLPHILLGMIEARWINKCEKHTHQYTHSVTHTHKHH